MKALLLHVEVAGPGPGLAHDRTWRLGWSLRPLMSGWIVLCRIIILLIGGAVLLWFHCTVLFYISSRYFPFNDDDFARGHSPTVRPVLQNMLCIYYKWKCACKSLHFRNCAASISNYPIYRRLSSIHTKHGQQVTASGKRPATRCV